MRLIRSAKFYQFEAKGEFLFGPSYCKFYKDKNSFKISIQFLSNMFWKSFLFSIFIALFISTGIFDQAMAQETSFSVTSSGIWTDINGGANHQGEGTNEIHWGTGLSQYDYKNSGLRFDGLSDDFTLGEEFCLGVLTHYNWPVYNAADGADLQITLDFSSPAISDVNFDFTLGIDETTNPSGQTCAQASCTYSPCLTIPCPDRVTFPGSISSTSFTYNGYEYTLQIVGFRNQCPPGGSTVTGFVTQETLDNTAYLVGKIILTSPAIHIEKSTNGADADTGTGPTILTGCPVTWTYTVTNAGYYALRSVSVTDSPAQTISRISGDTDGDNILDLTETWIYRATGIALDGQYSNTAQARGRRGSDYPYVYDTDPSHYLGQNLIFSGPVSQTVCNGDPATFSVSLTPLDSGQYNYQWQSSSNGGTTWIDIPGATGSSYNVAPATYVTPSMQYRVNVALKTQPDCWKNSNPATLTVRPGINLDCPADVSLCNGGMASFTVNPTPDDTGQYQYQWDVSTDGGSIWTPIATATSRTYSFTAGLDDDGNQYRVRVKYNTLPYCNEVTSCAAHLTVQGGPTVAVGDPITICVLDAAITLTGTATNALSAEWSVYSGAAYGQVGSTSYDSITGIATTTFTPTFISPSPDFSKDVVVKLTAYPKSPCSDPVSATQIITVVQKPSIDIIVLSP